MEKIKLKKGDILRVEGSLILQVDKGEVTVSGGAHGEGDEITIPRAKSLPLEAITDAVLEYEKGEGGEVERLSKRTIPLGWDSLVKEIVKRRPRTIIALGEVDTGKTFFTTYMANSLLRHGIKSAVVDTDIGQSDIGPPGTVGMGIVDNPIGLMTEVRTQSAYFIGSMSPSGHMLEFMVGMKKVAEDGLEKADLVIVDTPGWVSGGSGRALQLYSAELLEPDLIVALQREDELEHLLRSLPGEIRRISVSGEVRKRTKKERSFLRQKVLADYLKGSKKISLDLEKVKLERCYLNTGKDLDPKSLGVKGILHAEKIPEGVVIVSENGVSKEEIQKLEEKYGRVISIKKGDEKHVMIALIDKNKDLLGIGVIDKIDYKKKKLDTLTPIQDGNKVSAVQLGSMKVKLDGREVGTVRPGTF